MGKKKETRKYYFSVEDECEQLYLEWLKAHINETTESEYNVTFDCKVEKNPETRAKKICTLQKIVIYHFFDYESDETEHQKNFKTTLRRMRDVQKSGKTIKYKLGYSNLTFDLWILLHKRECNASLSHRRQYLNSINRSFDESFANMDEFKKADNFRRCLKKISLSDVKDAIKRSRRIMDMQERNGSKQCNEYGYQYYRENPSLSCWEAIEVILKDCGLM